MLVVLPLPEAALYAGADVLIISLAAAVFVEQFDNGHIAVDCEDALTLLGKVLLVQNDVSSGRTSRIDSL